jgi:hypothetical protein
MLVVGILLMGPDPRLCDLLKILSLGVETKLVKKIIINPEWFSGL